MLVALAVDNYSAGSERGDFARAQLILIAREIGKDSSEKIWLSRWPTAERPSVQTLRVGIKKLGRVGEGISDVYLAFCFGSKLEVALPQSKKWMFFYYKFRGNGETDKQQKGSHYCVIVALFNVDLI